jgi:hypothetical protein
MNLIAIFATMMLVTFAKAAAWHFPPRYPNLVLGLPDFKHDPHQGKAVLCNPTVSSYSSGSRKKA